MSTENPTTNKSADEESYKHMIPCGEYTMREGNAETHGADGINGTIVVPQSKVAAAGAGPKDEVRVKVEANGKTTTMERKIHSGGNTLTIPLEERQKLNLEPGDTIKFWIESVDNEHQQTQKRLTQEQREDTPSNGEKETYVFVNNSFTYHLLNSNENNKTVCGLSIKDLDTRFSDHPFSAFDACLECKAHSGEEFTDEEIIELLAEKVDKFEVSAGQPTQLSSDQLDAIKQVVLEKEEAEESLREYRARIARLEQKIQRLENKEE